MPSFVLESSTWSASTEEACFQPSMCMRIIRGTCLGHFFGCPCLEYTETEQIASLAAAAFGAGQAASGATPAATARSAEPGSEELFGFHKSKALGPDSAFSGETHIT